jgi:uncharacterized protein YuzE
LVKRPTTSDAAIDCTDELGPTLHVDLDGDGNIVGVEFLYRAHTGSTWAQ